MHRRVKDCGQQVGKGANGLQSFVDACNNRSEAHPHPAGRAPALQATVERPRPVQTVIDQKHDESAQGGKQQPAAVPRPVHPIHIRACVGELVGKHEQAQACENRGCGKIEKTFQKEDPEHACYRQAILPRKQQGPDRLAGSPQNENRGEAHQRSSCTCSRNRWGPVAAEALPAESANCITRVNRHKREQKQPNIRLADTVDEFPPRKVG